MRFSESITCNFDDHQNLMWVFVVVQNYKTKINTK